MELSEFNPETSPERVMKRYSECPGTLAFYGKATQDGHSEIHCVGDDGKWDIFFVPRQQLIAKRGETGNSLYIFIKVAKTELGEPQFWLVTCAFNRLGYLFPLAAFNDKGEYQPLPKAKTAA